MTNLEKEELNNGCAVYIRTSTEDQNPENQIANIETISGKDYELFKDKQSAWKDHIERGAFNNLKKAIQGRKIKDLYVWDLDRIYRNRKNLIGFFSFCNVYKCRIHSFRQQWLEQINEMPSPWDEIVNGLMLQVMGWLAEEESNKKSDRVKAAVRRQGKITKSYKGNKWGRKQLSTQKKNKINELRQSGRSIRQIAKELNISIGGVHKYILDNLNKKL